MRYFTRLMVILTGVWLVLGFVRYGVYGFDDTLTLLPSYDYFYEKFDTFPKIFEEIGAITAKYDEVCTPPNYTVGAGDWAGFLTTLTYDLFVWDGECSGMSANDFFQIVGIILSFPIRVIVWLCDFLFVV